MSAKKETAKKAAKPKPDGEKPASDPDASPAEPLQQLPSAGATTGSHALAEQQTGEKDGPPPSLSLDRVKIAELATQLVSAHITASAQLCASRNLAASNIEVASELLMAAARFTCNPIPADLQATLGNPNGALVDKAYHRLRDLASNNRRMPSDPPPLDHPTLDRVFAAALFRAQSMLISPDDDQTLVFAEQLFQPDERLSENQVEKRLADWRWPGLRNHEPFLVFMKKLEDWYAAYLSNLASVFTVSEHDESSFLEHAGNFCSRHKDDDAYQKLRDVISELAANADRRSPNVRSQKKLLDVAWHRYIIPLMFGDRKPGMRKPNAQRKYVPWALFRYLRMFGQEQSDGRELQKSLEIPRKDLSDDQNPYPVDTSRSTDAFGPLAKVVEKKIEAYHFSLVLQSFFPSSSRAGVESPP